jgi:hypothetical protein
MRRLTRMSMVLLLAAVVFLEGIGGAQGAGETVGPKDWDANIAFSSFGFSGTQTFFEGNACDWAGSEDSLNGMDALIWDITGYEGLPAVYSWSAASDFGAVQTVFITAECQRMGGVAGGRAEEPDKPVEFLIPPLAKWITIVPIAPGATMDIDIKMHSDGTPKEEPKKKKKKKRRK